MEREERARNEKRCALARAHSSLSHIHTSALPFGMGRSMTEDMWRGGVRPFRERGRERRPTRADGRRDECRGSGPPLSLSRLFQNPFSPAATLAAHAHSPDTHSRTHSHARARYGHHRTPPPLRPRLPRLPGGRGQAAPAADDDVAAGTPSEWSARARARAYVCACARRVLSQSPCSRARRTGEGWAQTVRAAHAARVFSMRRAACAAALLSLSLSHTHTTRPLSHLTSHPPGLPRGRARH
jgi:hypothetical protein